MVVSLFLVLGGFEGEHEDHTDTQRFVIRPYQNREGHAMHSYVYSNPQNLFLFRLLRATPYLRTSRKHSPPRRLSLCPSKLFLALTPILLLSLLLLRSRLLRLLCELSNILLNITYLLPIGPELSPPIYRISRQLFTASPEPFTLSRLRE